MENFIFSLNATMPLILLAVLGWLMMRVGLFTPEFVRVADKFVFQVALPVMLFRDIATADIREIFNPQFVAYCMLATTAMFGATWALTALLMKDKSMVGAFVQASARGSAAVMGIAFVNNIYGNSGMAPLMLVSAVPLYNIYSVIILTVHARGARRDGKALRRALLNVLKNPIIIGVVAGIPFSALGVTVPAIPLKVLDNLAGVATPLALLAIGASFEGPRALKKIRPTLLSSLIKLVLIPAALIPFAIGAGFRGPELVALLVMLGAPTTVTCYVMAKQMGNDEVLTSSCVMMATLLSSVTLTLWIFLFRTLGLI
ncbi:MAG: AEC family transporter [Clostridia bacterium]|nr:AEC family transporter [Clostridia bacterium]